MYQSGRAGDEAKKCKSPAKSGRVGIYAKIMAVPYIRVFWLNFQFVNLEKSH